jgi:hypothetical protein
MVSGWTRAGRRAGVADFQDRQARMDLHEVSPSDRRYLKVAFPKEIWFTP